MKKIFSSILIALICCLSVMGQEKVQGSINIGVSGEVNFNLGNETRTKEQIISLLQKDVFGYFDLKQKYSTPLKQQTFLRTEEYTNYLQRLERDYSIFTNSEFSISYNLRYNSPYDIDNKCFIFKTMIADFLRTSLSDYIGFEGNINASFPQKYLKIQKVRAFDGELYAEQYIRIPLADKECALKIETDMENPYCSTSLVFIVKLDKVVSEKNPEFFWALDNILLETERLYIANTKTGEVYCDLSMLLYE